MVNRLFTCDADRLRSYLDDELGSVDEAELARHLDQCGHCQKALERLAAGSRLWKVLPHLGHDSEQEASVETQDLRPDQPRERPTPSNAREGLEFLAPSDNPAHLGRLGPYEIVGVLGQGGMGVVLKAIDPALNRVIAIKVLAPQLAASGAARKRFSREAKAAAAVVHDHVIAIHAVDADPDNGLPYLVMPYVAGQSLQERIERDGPLRAEVILRIGMQTALGLAAAHAQGLVHRDIKPSNILLENGLERVRITDFGLARAVDDASHSQSGFVIGTPQYMSPEQARGEVVDHRSDLFSLGSVLYAMCTGHSPFRAKTTMGVLRRVSDDTPRPPSEINPDLPEDLEEVIDRLHAKDPSSRYQTAAEVAEVLGRLLADRQRPGARPSNRKKGSRRRPVSARKPAGGPLPWILRTRTRIGLGVASLLVAVIGLGMAANSGHSGSSEGLIGSMGWFQQGGAPARVEITGSDDDRTIIGSGKPATKRWDLADFNGVEIQHPFRVELSRADKTEVTVTADDNVLGHVQVVKQGDRLQVHLEEGHTYRLRRDSLRVVVALPSLEFLGLTHGARATIAGFDSKRPFEANLSHGSGLEGRIGVGRLDLAASHGSEMTLLGTADTARLDASHGSHLALKDLVIRDAEIQIEHGSGATIHARPEHGLKANVEHSSTLEGEVEGGDLTLEAAHGGGIALKGSAQKAAIQASHSSRLLLGGLAVEAADLRLEHSSSARVHAKSKLDYHLEHSSRIEYLGHPTVGESEATQGSSARSVPAPEPGNTSDANASLSANRPRDRSRENGGEIITINLEGMRNGAGSMMISNHSSETMLEGSGRRAVRTFDLKDFTKVEVDRLIAAEITRADAFGVSMSADDNILDRLIAVREGSILRLSLAEGSYRLRERPRAVITLPVLDSIGLDGASQAKIQGFSTSRPFQARVSGASKLEGSIGAGDLDLNVGGASTLVLGGSAKDLRAIAHGASTLKLDDLKLGASQVIAEATGASTVQIRGSAQSATVKAQGASSLALADLALENADVELSGASSATVRVKSLLNYDLNSASRLRYLGDPKIGKAEREGASSVSH